MPYKLGNGGEGQELYDASTGKYTDDGIPNKNEVQDRKQKQLDIILNHNPAHDNYHTWIRKVEDIKTFEEVLLDEDYEGSEDFDPDWNRKMAQKAIDTGYITVYSSYPIEQGIFVSPSKMEAQSYSGNGRVYSKTVPIDSIAWIDPTQGQYADYKSVIQSENRNKNNLGQELSEGQKHFFKDSKARDENGNLKVFYHGTPDGTFTSFRPHSYFTEDKNYASTYKDPNASSISNSFSKKNENPTVHAVYLNIKKPFDIRDPKVKDIYYNEFIKGGYSSFYDPYTPKSMINNLRGIDWNEGIDLFEFLTEVHPEYGYDGLVLDEGGTGGYGFEVKDRGLSWVNFYPNQVKRIENQNPTQSDDMYENEQQQAMRLFGLGE